MSVKIIGEVAWSHDGDVEKNKILIRNCSTAEVDIVNFHATSIPDYITKNFGDKNTLSTSSRQSISDIYSFLDNNNISAGELNSLLEYSRSLNLMNSVMINDQVCLDELRDDLIDYYCISPATVDEIDLLHKIKDKSKGRKIFLRCATASKSEIKNIVEIFGKSNLILLHGVQGYPSKIEDCELSILKYFKEEFDCEIGLADHIDASKKESLILPLLSIPLGATYIEKHVTFSRKEKGEDFESALELHELIDFVKLVKSSENAIGNGDHDGFLNSSLIYNNTVRKRILCKNFIASGTKINRSHLIFKRANQGLNLNKINDILNKTTSKDLDKDAPIELTDLLEHYSR